MKAIYIIFILGMVFVPMIIQAQNPADQIIGQYWNPDRTGKVEIYKTNDKYFGKIISRKEGGKDAKNPDPNLRNRDLVGLVFLKDFEFNGKNKWINGEVYAFDNGGTYSGKLWMDGTTLKMRGYLGISLFGRTVAFEPVK